MKLGEENSSEIKDPILLLPFGLHFDRWFILVFSAGLVISGSECFVSDLA